MAGNLSATRLNAQRATSAVRELNGQLREAESQFGSIRPLDPGTSVRSAEGTSVLRELRRVRSLLETGSPFVYRFTGGT